MVTRAIPLTQSQDALLLLIVDAPRLPLSDWAGARNIPGGSQMPYDWK